MPHLPLSQELARILGEAPASGGVTLNEVLVRTEGRGLFGVIVLLCLPFVAPVSVPGMSTPLGLAILVIAVRLALRKPPRLPRRLGDRALAPKVRKAILGGGLKVLRFLEKGVRPRRTFWMSWPVTRLVNAAVVGYAALLLALPLPPLPPFTNALPSYSVILLAASMMEEDGVMIWAGYAVTLGTTVYFLVCAELIARHFHQWFQALGHWLHLST
ncbi:MAG: exopolysaccharide biosynthesis protein [Verrucomicrobia bacterium]|nr:exopolysaccharide biosynthesis protein [Verrucomicrobiota bacterium]